MNKVFLIPFELKSACAEEELSKPIEIQLWKQIEYQEKYQEVEEQQVGVFFLDLNEITRVQNPYLKAEASEYFCSHDGYYTMLDKTNEKVTNDRLGLKVQIFAKDSDASLDILTRMQHEIITNIYPQILEEHDINLKGTIDLHELQSLINSSIKDREVREYLEAFSNLLELKNSTKVFYGPLFNLLPPVFKHARRVDKFKIIEIMDK